VDTGDPAALKGKTPMKVEDYPSLLALLAVVSVTPVGALTAGTKVYAVMW